MIGVTSVSSGGFSQESEDLLCLVLKWTKWNKFSFFSSAGLLSVTPKETYHKNNHLAWINTWQLRSLVSRIKTEGALSEKWSGCANKQRKKPCPVWIGPPLIQLEERWYMLQGQQNSFILHPSYFSFFCQDQSGKGAQQGHLRGSFKQHKPRSRLAGVCATQPEDKGDELGAGCRLEHYHYRLSFNRASFKIHCL